MVGEDGCFNGEYRKEKLKVYMLASAINDGKNYFYSGNTNNGVGKCHEGECTANSERKGNSRDIEASS